MSGKVTLSQVRRLHDSYGEAVARWGEDNQATVRALVVYWDARNAYEASSGKGYDPR